MVDGKRFRLAGEVHYIQRRAADYTGRVISIGQLILFSTSRFPSFFEGRGNKRIVDAELFCEKNRGRAIRWEQVDDVQQKIEYRLKE
jgi:hypothetical protein